MRPSHAAVPSCGMSAPGHLCTGDLPHSSADAVRQGYTCRIAPLSHPALGRGSSITIVCMLHKCPEPALTYATAAPSRLVLAACMVCADPTTGEEVRGLCSNYLADVKPGDELVMTGPAGTALLLADNPWQKRIVCVSTGVCVCRGDRYRPLRNLPV